MPSSLTKEGGADERDGNFDIIACNIYSPVIHRQSQKEISIPDQPKFRMLISLLLS